jgi:hypothetical protein
MPAIVETAMGLVLVPVQNTILANCGGEKLLRCAAKEACAR